MCVIKILKSSWKIAKKKFWASFNLKIWYLYIYSMHNLFVRKEKRAAKFMHKFKFLAILVNFQDSQIFSELMQKCRGKNCTFFSWKTYFSEKRIFEPLDRLYIIFILYWNDLYWDQMVTRLSGTFWWRKRVQKHPVLAT